MSVMTTIDIQCDQCGHWKHGGMCKTAREAKIITRAYGWKVKIDGSGYTKDLCTVCQGKELDWEARNRKAIE